MGIHFSNVLSLHIWSRFLLFLLQLQMPAWATDVIWCDTVPIFLVATTHLSCCSSQSLWQAILDSEAMPSHIMVLRRSLAVGLGIFLSRFILVLRRKSDRSSLGFWWRESREERGLVTLRLEWAYPKLELHRGGPAHSTLLAELLLCSSRKVFLAKGCCLCPRLAWLIDCIHLEIRLPIPKTLDQGRKNNKYLSNLGGGYLSWQYGSVGEILSRVHACLSCFKTEAWSGYQLRGLFRQGLIRTMNVWVVWVSSSI